LCQFMKFRARFYGKTNYQDSLGLQEEAVLLSHENPQILGFEFDPVITLGRSAKEAQEVVQAAKWPTYRVPRGGKATFHSPGQLVIYPICNIKVFEIGVRSWVERQLKVTQRTLQKCSPNHQFQVSMERAGVYSEVGKVASIGIRLERGVSTFGLAINLKNDPQLFECIRPCGVTGQIIHAVGGEGSLEDFFYKWCEDFEKEF